jgi:hypothetical protein
MDARPEVLAKAVRARRVAIDNDLEEERRADEMLTHLAERFVNPQSIRAPGGEGWRRRH